MEREEYIKTHFPDVDPGARPCGNQILVQLRTLQKKSSGGIILANETHDFNQHNTQLARVVKLGQIAFRHRETGETWREGAWAAVGDIVVMPKYGGFRTEAPIPGTEDVAIFCIYNDYDVKMVVEGNFEAFDKIL